MQLYLPLILPLALELGGFVLLALGLAPRCREFEPEIEPLSEPVAIATPVATPATVKRGSSAYYLQRLQRDHSAIAKRIATGELSVYAASVAAGLRKAPAKSKWATIDTYVKPVRENA